MKLNHSLKKPNTAKEERLRLTPFSKIYSGVLPAEIIDRKTVISMKNRFLYSRIAKAANSTVMANLSKMETGIENLQKDTAPFSKLGSLTEDELQDIGTYFKFTVVRDPFARIRSAYLNKIQRSKKLHVHRYFEIPNYQEVSLDQFLEYLENGGVYENAHWARQTDLLYFPVENYDYIGKAENLDDDLRAIMKTVYGTSRTIISVDHHQTHSIDFTISDSQKKRIYNLYKNDFDSLGYSF